MTSKRLPSESWEACPPGTLAGFAAQEHGRQRRKVLLKVGTVAASLLLLIAAYFVWPEQGPDFGGVSCAVVHANLEPYEAHKLDARLTRQFDRHLSLCPHCKPELEKLRAKSKGITFWWRVQKQSSRS